MKIGIVGHRGIVGRVFIENIIKNNINKNNIIFLKSLKGNKDKTNFLKTIDFFKDCDILVSCKGSEFTRKNIKKIKNWKGYWLDASSFLRKDKNVPIVLDPINKKKILFYLKKKCRVFSGGNCTVSLMLMALRGLIKEKVKIKEIFCTTYQAISGAGFGVFDEFLNQVRFLTKKIDNNNFINNEIIINEIRKKQFPKINIGYNLAFSLKPWIDEDVFNGSSKEEEKAVFETEKILNKNISIYSTCVRVNCLRCHSQSLVIKLSKDLSLKEFIKKISKSKYSKIIDNDRISTIKHLDPINIQGSKYVFIGRIRKLKKKTFSIFTIGDQLIWGACEPLLRMLKIIIRHENKN